MPVRRGKRRAEGPALTEATRRTGTRSSRARLSEEQGSSRRRPAPVAERRTERPNAAGDEREQSAAPHPNDSDDRHGIAGVSAGNGGSSHSTLSIRVNESPMNPTSLPVEERAATQPKVMSGVPTTREDEGPDRGAASDRTEGDGVTRDHVLATTECDTLSDGDVGRTARTETGNEHGMGCRVETSSRDEQDVTAAFSGVESPRDNSEGAEEEDMRVIKGMLRQIYKLNKELESHVVEKMDVSIWVDSAEELRNIIHSLFAHLDGGRKSVIDSKLTPLNKALDEGAQKRCFSKFVVDYLVKTMGGDSADLGGLKKLAAAVRTLLYSTNSGGRKDYARDADEMQMDHNEMRKKLTYLCVNLIQRDWEIGRIRTVLDGEEKIVEKPLWMRDGFTKGIAVTDFYKNRALGKKGKPMEDTYEGHMQYNIIRKIHECYNASLNRVRDRVRSDGMRGFWFLLEEHDFEYVVKPLEPESRIDISTIPLVNVGEVEKNGRNDVLRKIWKGLLEIVGDKMVYKVEYDVMIKETKEVKRITRKFNLLGVSAMLLLRLSCTTSLVEFMAIDKNSLRLIVCFGEVICHIMTLHLKGTLRSKLLTLDREDGEYHIVKMVEIIRPMRSSTRTDFVRSSIAEMMQRDFERCNVVEGASDESEQESESAEEEDVLVTFDEEDGLDAELGDAINFLLS